MGQGILRRVFGAGAAVLLLIALSTSTGRAATNAPFGSYLLSCRGASVQQFGGGGGKLTAFCKTNEGQYVQSTLPLPCNADIANINGQLRCGAGTAANQPPSGSYQQSCNAIYMTGQVLHATCRRRDGQLWQTTLNAANCTADIANIDGQLSCMGNGNFNQPPSGTYQQSCNGAFMNGTILVARCRDMNGQMVSTQLNVQGCGQDIANINGNLSCGRQNLTPIKIFAGPGWQGASRTIQSAVSDLRTIGFGNMAQSIAISQGTWEFCTGPNFGGRCQRFNHGVANLNQIGFGSQIVSIRPVF